MDISLVLIIGFFIILIVSYLRINIKRLRGYNIFMPSTFMSWILALLSLCIIIIRISDMIKKGDSGTLIYIEIIVYCITAYRLPYDSLEKLEVKVENIYKSQLENLLEDAFSKRNLTLIKEESDDERTLFSFVDQHIKSKIHIQSSSISTRRHILIIEHKNDIPNLKDILEDMDAMIPPISKTSILKKFLFKVAIFAYIVWKIIGLFE